MNGPRNLADMLRTQAIARPATPAVVTPSSVFSHRALYIGTCMLADKLRKAGVSPGQVVAITMGQSALHVMTMLAIARLGATSLPLSAHIPPDARARVARRFNAELIVTGQDKYRIDSIPCLIIGSIEIHDQAFDANAPIYPVNDDTPCRIALSSGTTADPKGILCSHGYLWDRMAKTNYACTPLSRLLPMDLNFTIGFVFALGVLEAGGTLVIPEKYDPESLARAINTHAVTHLLLSPAQAQQLCDILPDHGAHFPTLTHLRIVGDTPSKKLLDLIRQRCSPQVYLPYGSTEMGPVAIATPETLAQYPLGSGPILPWVSVEIVDENDHPLPAGQTGQLRIKVQGMAQGFHLDPERTREQFRNGWYYPGDLGHLSADGHLFLEGRLDDVINLGGEKVLPHPIEETLDRHPRVRESVVFAIEAETGKQELAAAVIPDGTMPQDLQQYCIQSLGKMVPRLYFGMTDFPRTPSGKIVRQQVAKIALQMRKQHNNVN